MGPFGKDFLYILYGMFYLATIVVSLPKTLGIATFNTDIYSSISNQSLPKSLGKL